MITSNSKTNYQKIHATISDSDVRSSAIKESVGGPSSYDATSNASVNSRGELLSEVITKDERRAHAGGATSNKLWDLRDPHQGIDSLIPSLLSMNKIEITKVEYKNSAQLAQELRDRGDEVSTLPFRHYRPSTYTGQTRAMDNLDCMKGKEPVYGDMDNFRLILQKAKKLQSEMLAYYQDSDDLVARCEMEDLPKLCMQQWKRPGWYLDSPITTAHVPEDTDHMQAILDRIAVEYKKHLPPQLDTQDFRALALMDYDPDDTMTGTPLFASGDKTHEARVTVLKALANPGKMSAEEWFTDMLSLQARMGWPDPLLYSPVLSTRLGPRAKPMRLWVGSDAYMESYYEALGAFCRVRFVYPAPYHVNYLWSPLYEQLSNCRRNFLGLWHDPESQSKYVTHLQHQGKRSYAVDFSGMDTAMFPRIIMTIARALRKAGFCKWPLDLMLTLYPHIGVIFPSLEGGEDNVSIITGPSLPWFSGFKLTSEFDTLYGLAVILDSLSQQIPSIFDDWASGRFVICELGDDIIFTTDYDIDVDALSKYALTTWGATLKINRDIMFLKWMLPIGGSRVKQMAKPFARVLQQTLFNEDRYSGVEGGDRPPAVMRLALKARCTGLKNHPDFDRWKEPFLDIVRHLEYVKNGPSSYISDVLLGDRLALDCDIAEVMNYANKQPKYFLNLQERAKYEPSAAFLASMWTALGISTDQTPALEIRKIYDAALFSDPTPSDINRLVELTQYNVS